jgi:hypothetical protein
VAAGSCTVIKEVRNSGAGPLLAILRNLRWQWLLLVLGLAFCGWAFGLQQVGVPSLGANSGQVLVTLYVRSSDARTLLRSFVFPNDQARDHLSVSVQGKNGQPDPWLLVIQCPSGSGLGARHQVPLVLRNAPAGPANERVRAVVQPPGGPRRQWRVPLGCFAAPVQRPAGHAAGGAAGLAADLGLSCLTAWQIRFGCAQAPAGRAAGTSSGDASGQIINATLPTLEGDPAAALKNVSTPVYAEERADGTIKGLVEVYQPPGFSCPTGSATPSPSPRAARSRPGPSPSPSPSVSPKSIVNPPTGCGGPEWAGAAPVTYYLPASVETTETLENTSLAGDRVDSMFPPGQIKSNDQIYWQGVSGLSPSLSATNLAAEARDSEYSFFAGVLYGLGLSLIFAFVQIVLTAASGNTAANAAAGDPRDS